MRTRDQPAWVAQRRAGTVTSVRLQLLSVGCASPRKERDGAAGDATWFEGARLIDGNGGAPIEPSAFLVEDGVFAWVGRQGERDAPEGAARVDLSGKTVIPALIDAHQHIGLTNVKDGTHSKDNYTLANLVEHLERSAYHGVAATMSLGLEFDEALAFELRNAGVPRRGALPDVRAGHSRHADGRAAAGVPARHPARSADRRRRTRGGRGAGGPRGRHHQDLGRRPGRHGPEAGAERSTGRSSTRRTRAACGWRRISARPAGWPTRRT